MGPVRRRGALALQASAREHLPAEVLLLDGCRVPAVAAAGPGPVAAVVARFLDDDEPPEAVAAKVRATREAVGHDLILAREDARMPMRMTDYTGADCTLCDLAILGEGIGVETPTRTCAFHVECFEEFVAAVADRSLDPPTEGLFR